MWSDPKREVNRKFFLGLLTSIRGMQKFTYQVFNSTFSRVQHLGIFDRIRVSHREGNSTTPRQSH